MIDRPLVNIRMHASRDGRHLTGAERLSGEAGVDELARALLRRGLEHRGAPDRIALSIEAVAPGAVRPGRLPDVRTCMVDDHRQGREAAAQLLLRAGVSPFALQAALTALIDGGAPGGENMRGAMLIDAASGRRLEPDRRRGVRATRMDLTPQASRALDGELERLGLDRRRVRDALVLAAKVLATPGIVAELCWSDDPDYTAGYVALPQHGYIRIPHLKAAGDPRGGRAFFLRGAGLDLPAVLAHLENSVLLIEEIGVFHPPCRWEP